MFKIFDCPYGPVDIPGEGEGGVLVPPHDIAGLAIAIDRLLGDTDLRVRLAAVAPAVAGRFALSRIGSKYAHLIEAFTKAPLCPS